MRNPPVRNPGALAGLKRALNKDLNSEKNKPVPPLKQRREVVKKQDWRKG
jgi:hypothetical protein